MITVVLDIAIYLFIIFVTDLCLQLTTYGMGQFEINQRNILALFQCSIIESIMFPNALLMFKLCPSVSQQCFCTTFVLSHFEALSNVDILIGICPLIILSPVELKTNLRKVSQSRIC